MLLVVDDEPRQRRFIANTIRKLRTEKSVIEACNGQEALQKVSLYPVTSVITDIRMPMMDGLEFVSECKKIREDIMVVFLSAYPDFDYAQQAIRMGAIDYVVKPVNEEILNEVVKKIEQIQKKQDSRKRYDENTNEKFVIEESMLAIKDYIGKHYMENLTRDEVANRFHFSPSYFSIIFKKTFDVTFSEYLTEIRMEQASYLLREGNDNIAVIAQRTGYNDVKYFLRVFKKYYKCTPKDYRYTREINQ